MLHSYVTKPDSNGGQNDAFNNGFIQLYRSGLGDVGLWIEVFFFPMLQELHTLTFFLIAVIMFSFNFNVFRGNKDKLLLTRVRTKSALHVRDVDASVFPLSFVFSTSLPGLITFRSACLWFPRQPGKGPKYSMSQVEWT